MFEKDLPGHNTAGFNDKVQIGELPFEMCETMNNSWGFNLLDTSYKSTKDLAAAPREGGRLRREPAPERRPHAQRQDPARVRLAPARGRPVAREERRGHLRHPRRTGDAPATGASPPARATRSTCTCSPGPIRSWPCPASARSVRKAYRLGRQVAGGGDPGRGRPRPAPGRRARSRRHDRGAGARSPVERAALPRPGGGSEPGPPGGGRRAGTPPGAGHGHARPPPRTPSRLRGLRRGHPEHQGQLRDGPDSRRDASSWEAPQGEAGRADDEGPQVKVAVPAFWMGQVRGHLERVRPLCRRPARRRSSPSPAAVRRRDPTDTALCRRVVRVQQGPAAGPQHHPSRGHGVLPLALRAHRARPTACRPRPSGSTPAAPGPRRGTRSATTRRVSAPRLVAGQRRRPSASGGPEEAQRLGPLRHARQPRGVGARHLRRPDLRRPGRDTGGPVAAPVIVPDERRFPHVVRGGSWDDPPAKLRSAARRSSEASWNRRDPQRPQSIWWLTDATHVGFRARPAGGRAERASGPEVQGHETESLMRAEKTMSDEKKADTPTRRDFLKTGAALVGGTLAAPVIPGAWAAGSDEIKVGLIGCGGRGRGALTDAIESSEGVRLVAAGRRVQGPRRRGPGRRSRRLGAQGRDPARPLLRRSRRLPEGPGQRRQLHHPRHAPRLPSRCT